MCVWEKIKLLIELTRPKQWFKSMYLILGAAPAIFLTPPNMILIPLLLFGGIINLILMQGVIYTINDIADIDEDKKHPTKSKRPIASGRISIKIAAMVETTFLFLALCWGYLLHPLVAIVNILFLLNAVLYNIKPFRLKEKRYFDLISAAFNFPLRVFIGWSLFEPYNEARLSISLGIKTTQLVSNSIQSILFTAPPRIIDIFLRFSSITISTISIISMTFFIAIFMLSLKRFAEKECNLGKRTVLSFYSKRELTIIARIAAILAILGFILLGLSIKPIILISSPIAIYGAWSYYRMALHSATAAEPEKVFSKHPKIIATFIIFLLFAGILLFL